jgi:hypothetical protein
VIISFAWTTPALLAGQKTVTRRDWSWRHAAKFRSGELVDAYDKNPRFGGKRVAVIRLTERPMRAPLGRMPDSDYEAEGFAYMSAHGVRLSVNGPLPTRDYFEGWRRSGESLWVVRFELVEVCGLPESRVPNPEPRESPEAR